MHNLTIFRVILKIFDWNNYNWNMWDSPYFKQDSTKPNVGEMNHFLFGSH